jgi:hypothetical protein
VTHAIAYPKTGHAGNRCARPGRLRIHPPVTGSDVVRIRWQQASLGDVNRICNDGVPKIRQKRAWGCYRRTLDECTIVTAGPAEDPRLHDTIGHEVRHCFVGNFPK